MVMKAYCKKEHRKLVSNQIVIVGVELASPCEQGGYYNPRLNFSAYADCTISSILERQFTYDLNCINSVAATG